MASSLISVEEGLAHILEGVNFIGSERVELLSALGRVIAENITAPADIPLGTVSAMDGYAVQAADTEAATSEHPIVLKVVEDLPAGYVAKSVVNSGEAVRIMTGALLPDGADAVVMVEHTEKRDDNVQIFLPVGVGHNIRPCGEDVSAGELLITQGSKLTAAEIGVLASCQRPFVRVARRPVVAIISTGDELVEIEEPAILGKVVNSNSYSLAALIRTAGGIPVMQGIVPDNKVAIRRAIEAALAADFVISSGGVSVGNYDYVKEILVEMGAEIKFWRVSMKPGKPIVFAVLRDKPYFGLPGNTVSSMLSFLLFVRPALRKAMGFLPPYTLPEISVILASDARAKGDRRSYLRAMVDYREGQFYARLMPKQGSGVLSSMLAATVLVVLEEGVTEIKCGSSAKALVIGDLFH